MMHIVTPQMSRTPVIVANCVRNAGIGLALLPAVAPAFPQLDDIAAHGQSAILGLYAAVQNQAFGGSLDDIFLLSAGLSAIGALLALLLPSGSPRKRAAAAGREPGSGDEVSAPMHEIAA